MQRKTNSNFDGTNYTDTMQDLFKDTYQLPALVRRYDAKERIINMSHQPYDELFLWSLLLYSGNDQEIKLSKYFWSKAKYPIASCLVGIIAYRLLLNENFVPDDLKDKMKQIIA
jgi:hypothetical protein